MSSQKASAKQGGLIVTSVLVLFGVAWPASAGPPSQAAPTAALSAAPIKLRGEYTLVPPEYSLKMWEELMDRFASEGKNFIYFWGSGLFRSKRYPEALFYPNPKPDYLSHDDMRELVRYAHTKGIKFYMAVGGFAWLTMDTMAQLHPETRAVGSGGMCPNNATAREMNVGWIEDLYQTFPELDGVLVELRDEYGPCKCNVCERSIDRYGSKQYGRGELEFLKELSARLWKLKPTAEIGVCIGYGEHGAHANDVAFYEGIRGLGKDPRWFLVEVRYHWRLPGTGGIERPLSYFSPRVVAWYQPEFHTAAELADWVRRAAREHVEGVCLGRTIPTWNPLDHITSGNEYIAPTLRVNLGLLAFITMARNPGWSDGQFRDFATRKFFGPAAGARERDALFYLDDLLLRAALGWGPAGNYYAPDPKPLHAPLEKAADPAQAAKLTQDGWNQAFALSRAIRTAGELEAQQLRDISCLAARIATQVPQEERSRFTLVDNEIDFLKRLLYLGEDDALLLTKAYYEAAGRVSNLRRRVVATSEGDAASSATNLFDGNPNTNWRCGNSVPLPQSVTLELPAAEPIQRVTLSQSSQRLDYNTRRYRIEGSLNGYNFQPIAEGELPMQVGASQTNAIAGKTARFVRIVVLSVYPETAFTSPGLSEVEIMAGGKPLRELLQD